MTLTFNPQRAMHMTRTHATKQASVQPYKAAVTVTLLAFAANRRAAMRRVAASPLLLGARRNRRTLL